MRDAISSIVQWAAAVIALFIAPYYSIRTWASVVDPDIWWHIRTGDWIFAHHTVPRYAIFSQHLDRPWIAYSWLLTCSFPPCSIASAWPGFPSSSSAFKSFS